MADGPKPTQPTAPAQDCLACRATGAVVFSGVSGWLLYERSRVPRPQAGHRALLAVMSGAFAVAAAMRSYL